MPNRCSITLAAFVLLSLTPVASRAVTVHGLSSQPAGSATLTVNGGYATGGYSLEIGNIGSSGQDGVSIALPGSNGISIGYGPVSSPGEPIIHRDLACRAIGGSGTLESLAHLVEDRDLLGLRTYLEAPGSSEVTIEAWNGPDLVYSAVHPAGTEVTAAGIAIDEPGVHVTMSFDATTSGGVTIRTVNATVTRPTTIITIQGENFGANRYVLRAGVPLAPTIKCTEAQLLCAIDGSGGGGGGGAAGRLAIKTKGLPGPKHRAPHSSRVATVSAMTGAILEDAAAGQPDVRLHVSRNAADPDPEVLRLNGLPPGVPYIGDLAVTGLPPGEPYIGNARLNGLPPGTPYIGNLSVAVNPNFLTDTPGQSVSLQAQAVLSDWNGDPYVECSQIATWTTTALGSYLLEASSNDADQQITYELYRGPRQSTSLDGGFAHISASRSFRSHIVRCPDGSCRMSFGFPSNVVITNNGAVQDADSIVIVFRSGSGSTSCLGYLDEYVELHDVPSLVIRANECESSRGQSAYGLTLQSLGNATFVPEYAARRWPVRNLGSSGQDGVEIRIDGAVVVSGSHGVDVPFDPPVSLSTFKNFEMEAKDCDDGSCDASAAFRCFPAGQPHVQTCEASFPNKGGNPVYVWVDDGDAGFDYRDLDSDDDGVFDVAASPGTEVRLSRGRFTRGWSMGHLHESCEITFGAPVTIMVSGQPRIVENLRFVWNSSVDLPSSGAGYKLFSVTGQPTPVGEANNERGVGSFSLSEPGFLSTPEAIGDPGTHPTMVSRPVLKSFFQPTGEIRVADLDQDGRQDITRLPGFQTGDKPVQGCKLIWSPRSNRTGEHISGFGFEADYDSIGPWPDSMSVELEVKRTGFQTGDKIQICHRNGAYAYLVFEGETAPVDVTVEAHYQGALQASGPYDPVNGVAGSSPPGIIILEADLDGDGEYEPLCTNFPPGTTVTIGGAAYPCDALVFRIGGAVSEDDFLDELTVRLNGLPPGEPVIGTRIAALAPIGSQVDAPLPRRPVAFALSSVWPNPSAGVSAVRLALPAASRIRATVIDLAGRVVARLADRGFTAGEHVIRWDGRRTGGTSAPAGLYFVRVERLGASADSRVARLTRVR